MEDHREKFKRIINDHMNAMAHEIGEILSEHDSSEDIFLPIKVTATLKYDTKQSDPSDELLAEDDDLRMSIKIEAQYQLFEASKEFKDLKNLLNDIFNDEN